MSSSTLKRSFARARLAIPGQGSIPDWLPPVERREFWAVQGLVLLIAAIHSWVEHQHLLDEHSPIYLFPTTLYLIPIVLAAVNFGLHGAVLTAAWSAVLAAPNVILWHDGLEQAGELVQIAWLTVAAVFVGSRVDRERAARLEAERREAAQRASEERYRAIVDNVDEPIILLDDQRRIVEANSAAAHLLGAGRSFLRGREPQGPIGERILEAMQARSTGTVRPQILDLGDPNRWYELMPMTLDRSSGTHRTQLLLRDVTASYERERGLESITRQTLAAREEEQRRIARELHDGPLQSVVQLWRTLDAIALETPAPGDAHLLAARDTTEAVADELRRFSRDLRPSILDDLGIVAAIRTEAESFTRRTGISGRVHTTGTPERLDPNVELALLRITQEALRNVERHARATTVEIGLTYRQDNVRVVISDDGVGMTAIPTPSELLAGGHMGLIGMQERARMTNGWALLGPAASGGLSITLEMPIPSASVKARSGLE